MCGIVGLHLRTPSLHHRLGELLDGMLGQLADRGPDSAGIGLYGDPRYGAPGHARVGVLGASASLEAELAEQGITAVVRPGETQVVSAPASPEVLRAAILRCAPGAVITSYGQDLVVLKGAGHPDDLARAFDLRAATGWQGIGHTRMATESAVTSSHSHPFSVGSDLCLVHNGSFANHATIRRELKAEGVMFDSDNDSEVGARFIAHHLQQGADLDKALRLLCERFDGFYTLLVTTGDSFAVVRDAIACKPAVIAQTADWVAMASEYRALAGLPGIESALMFEPEPEEVYTWER